MSHVMGGEEGSTGGSLGSTLIITLRFAFGFAFAKDQRDVESSVARSQRTRHLGLQQQYEFESCAPD